MCMTSDTLLCGSDALLRLIRGPLAGSKNGHTIRFREL
jgi:hypothetical protein